MGFLDRLLVRERKQAPSVADPVSPASPVVSTPEAGQQEGQGGADEGRPDEGGIDVGGSVTEESRGADVGGSVSDPGGGDSGGGGNGGGGGGGD
jgi:hypothetical protein